MDKHAKALKLLECTLPHVPFDGWSKRALEQGAVDAGMPAGEVFRLFPQGAIDAADLFVSEMDRRMLAEYDALSPAPKKIRERITALVRLRLEAYAPHREAVRRAVALYALPMNAPRALAAHANTMDAMWRAAGDSSTDYNWYTKRVLLSGVYGSTLMYWLADDSEGYEKTWEFLDRRISDVMQIQTLKSRVREMFSAPLKKARR